MRRSRIVAALTVTFSFACGLDVTGGATTVDGVTADAASDDASRNDARADVPDADTDATTDVDAPTGITSLAVTVGKAPDNVALTSEGTLDWIYWGYDDDTGTPVRKAGGANAFSAYTRTGTNVNEGSSDDDRWPMRASWTDGDDPTSAEDVGWFTYFTGSSDADVTFTVAASTSMRHLAFYVGVSSAKVRVVAELPGIAPATVDFDEAGGIAKKVAVDFASGATGASATKLTVHYRVLTRDNASPSSGMLIAAATLR